MSDIRKKIEEIAVDDTSGWREKARYRRENRDWLRKSKKIAVRILNALDEKGMQQKQLAEAMGVSPQQVSKIVKGKQNLTLETIAKLEGVLDIQLFEVSSYQQKMDVSRKQMKKPANINKSRVGIDKENWSDLAAQVWSYEVDNVNDKAA